MANIHYTHQWDQDDYASDAQSYDVTPKSSILNPLKSLAYLLGAFISIALLGGIALWGYQLVERDVSGVPVVRAASGEMRVRPEDPGGQLAQNTGLSVNTIAAHGTAAAPADRLILAPRPLDLADVTVAELTDTAPSVADTQQPLHQASLRTDPDVANLVAALTEGESPLVNIQVDPAPSIIAAPVRVSLTSAAATEPVLIARVDGPTSLRPRVRPVQLARPAPAAPAVSRTAQVDELAFECDLTSFFEEVLHYFHDLSPDDDVVPLRVFYFLPLIVGIRLVGSQGERGHFFPALEGSDFGIAT